MSRDLKLLALLALLGVLGLAGLIVLGSLNGTIIVENRAPGTRIESVRWLAADGQQYGGSGSLLPGDSARLRLGYSQTNQPGKLRFELVVAGNRVVLTSVDSVQVAPWAEQKVAIDAKFKVTHGLSD